MRLLGSLLAALALLGACGGDRSGGPTGNPASIVESSAARTVREGTARIEVGTPNARGLGTVDLRTGAAHVTVDPPNQSDAEFTDPAVAIDVVRAMASVDVYGGNEVRGASTIKYELNVAPSPELLARLKRPLKGRTFYADVSIDSQHRIREVAYPLDLNAPRPDQAHKILAKLVTVDFYDFGTKVS